MICKKCNTDNPADAKFSQKCGYNFGVEYSSTPSANREGNFQVSSNAITSSTVIMNKPFHTLHPELHLKSVSEFEDLYFWFNKPNMLKIHIKQNTQVSIHC